MMFVLNKIKRLDNTTPEEEIAACIDRAKQKRHHSKKMFALLDYGHIVYNGRSKNETIRIRGYLFASFIDTGLPPGALPYILDELESSRSAFLVAGAAIALRGLRYPNPQLTGYLFKAIKNIRAADDAICFDIYKPQWPRNNYTTALAEIFKAFQWMGHYASHASEDLRSLQADPCFSQPVRLEIEKALNAISIKVTIADNKCCEIPRTTVSHFRSNIKKEDLINIRMQDQEERKTGYNEFFSGMPSLLIFFYTRCDNPNRCSLNITRMGQLQKELGKQGLYGKVKVAAVTYDPAYDLPLRMKPYCTGRGFFFDDHSKCFRAEEGMDILLAYLKPGVNYNGPILNHHTSELFVLDKNGKPVKRIHGIEWNIENIIAGLKPMLNENKTRGTVIKRTISSALSVLLSTIVVFFPKCPFCAAAYLSLFGITQYEFFRLREWLFPLFIGLLLLNLFALFWMARRRQWFLPFYLSLAGACCIITVVLFTLPKPLAFTGIVLVVFGSLLNGLPGRLQERIRNFLSWPSIGLYFQKNHFSKHKPFKI